MAKGYGLAGQIDNYLKGKGSPLAGFGNVFVAAGKKHGVDPRLVVGIAGAESGFGKHNFAAHNAWGWNVHNNQSFSSWPEAITTVTRGLGTGYISKGMLTPAAIVKHYAPSSDGNDESVWSGNVSTFMKELGASPTTATAKTSIAAPTPPPAAAVPSSLTLPSFPELPPLEPSTSNLTSALISNLGVIAQRGNASGTGLLSSVLQGTLADKSADEAAQAQRADYEKQRKDYLEALQKATAALPEATPPEETTPKTTNSSTTTGSVTIPVAGELIGRPGEGTHSRSEGPANWESDNAVDIAVPEGTPIHAVADGKIGPNFGALSNKDPRFAGLRLHIMTDDNNFYYAHLSKFAPGIEVGTEVKAGQIIGYSGSANGVAHLHFAQRDGNPASRYDTPSSERVTPGGKPAAGLAEAFYDPLGSYDPQSNPSSPWGGAIGNHSDHVHLSITDPKLMLSMIKLAQDMGLSVRENPYVDPVDPVHTDHSFHYRDFPGTYGGKKLGQAIDVSGSPALMAKFYKLATGT